MRQIDYARAFGIAAAIVAIDFLVGFALVYFYELIFLGRGHPHEYYVHAGIPVARLSTRIVGTALILSAAWLSGMRTPERNAYGFAAMLAGSYVLLDAVSWGFSGVFSLGFAFTAGLRFAGAEIGAYLAERG